MQIFEDIMFDTDPLEIADELAVLPEPILAVIVSDDEAEVGSEIFFGLSTSTGEIVEIKAQVNASEATDDDLFSITVTAVEADVTMLKLATDSLTGKFKENDESGPMWALGLKQQNNTFAILANSPGGVLTAEQLAVISEITAAGAGIAKLTHAQRVVLLVNAEQIEQTEHKLKAAGLRVGVLHHGIRNVRACCGALCRFSQKTDAVSLAQEIDDRFFGRGTAFDVKIAVSDCMRNCSECYCADIGLIAANGKYTIVVGGRGSQVPFRAINLVSNIPQDKATDAIEEIVNWYIDNAEKGERLCKLLLRLGQDGVNVDMSAIESALVDINDGIDESARIRDHLTRLSGVSKMRASLKCCN